MIFDNLIKTDDEVLGLVSKGIAPDENILITYLNQNCFNIYKDNSDYAKIIETFFHVYLDGFGIYLAMLALKYKGVKRFNATDLNEKILNELNSEKKKIYLVGGNFSEVIISGAIKKGVNICGYHKGYFDEDMEARVIKEIVYANPDVIFIAMGVPKQEFFAAKLSSNLKGKLIICVGNFFEFYFQNIKRISPKLRNIGVEWFFRLLIEPKRLWKRYIIGIPLFSIFILKEKFKRQV